MRQKLAALCGAFSIVTGAHAAIINGGFELPALGLNSFNNEITSWTKSGTGGVWHYNPESTTYFSEVAPDGVQVGFLNSGSAAQQTSDVLAEGLTTLYFSVGRRNDAYEGDVRFEIWAGGTVATGAVNGGTMLASSEVLKDSLVKGSWKDFSLTYTAGANDAMLGEKLSVRIVKLNGGQVDFDRVSWSAVPEPFSLMGLGLGALGLISRRRSK
ncbi:MAG: PEP-CTERM sorting domain-containing protein [Armatimonadetes bacterium]|nr:PEP-CTERM sorting domain-containing protein [Armatimonadota bacterium]